MMRRGLLRLAGAALAALALVQGGPATAQGFPEALRGFWFAGSCEDPSLVLRVSGASIAELPSQGEQTLLRARSILPAAEGWILATDASPEQRRRLLRAEPPGLLRPDPKTLDAALPGSAAPVALRRCPTLPPRTALLHGEGLRFLDAVERIEAVCFAESSRACIDALLDHADVSRDGALSTAEIARLVRGATYVSQLAAGSSETELAAGLAAGSLAALAFGQALIQAVDYNADGKASLEELLQDRLPIPDAPTTGPVLVDGPLGALAGEAGALRGLFDLLWGEVLSGMP